ncbi:hypothetical protein [Arthrobacter mobilis]|uniref:Uncharacterized protein n=1 Tax=Arthrobacter mobilis TaxID=2724944 RepID=A0A7X6HGZ8_9MICC|nr:hypothetical protein [Arthrobacter mobilis]NKX55983.1 hypothetical protein [Arthrobacter mobilis]
MTLDKQTTDPAAASSEALDLPPSRLLLMLAAAAVLLGAGSVWFLFPPFTAYAGPWIEALRTLATLVAAAAAGTLLAAGAGLVAGTAKRPAAAD